MSQLAETDQPRSKMVVWPWDGGNPVTKIQGDLRPWAVGYRQRVEKTSRPLMGNLVLAADRAGPHKLTGVLLQRGPPESPLDYVLCMRNPRVAGEVGVVHPLRTSERRAAGTNRWSGGQALGPE